MRALSEDDKTALLQAVQVPPHPVSTLRELGIALACDMQSMMQSGMNRAIYVRFGHVEETAEEAGPAGDPLAMARICPVSEGEARTRSAALRLAADRRLSSDLLEYVLGGTGRECPPLAGDLPVLETALLQRTAGRSALTGICGCLGTGLCRDESTDLGLTPSGQGADAVEYCFTVSPVTGTEEEVFLRLRMPRFLVDAQFSGQSRQYRLHMGPVGLPCGEPDRQCPLWLDRISPELLSAELDEHHIQMTTLCLGLMHPTAAAGLLMELEQRRRAEVILRLLDLPETLHHSDVVPMVLKGLWARLIASLRRKPLDTVAAILRSCSQDVSRSVVQAIQEELHYPELVAEFGGDG